MPAKKKDDRSLKALEAVAAHFAKNPNASNEEFRKIAEKADASVAKLSPRSFNGKYVLPLKRSAAAASGKGKVAARKAAERITAKAAGKKTKKKKRKKKKKTRRKTGARKKKKRTGNARQKAAAKGTLGVTPADVTKLRDLVAKRDQEAMAAVDDPSRAYRLAEEIDSFVQKVLKIVR